MLNADGYDDDAFVLKESEQIHDPADEYVIIRAAEDYERETTAFLCEYAQSEPAQISLPERRAIRGNGNSRYIRLLGKDEIPELITNQKHWRMKEPTALTGFIKRAMDIAGAAAGLILSAPLFLIIGLCLAFQRGPILFAQTRIGKNGKQFQCYKFRTMHVGAQSRLGAVLATDAAMRAEWVRHRKLAIDPRITGIGRLLRKTSLDELPQLFNVLKGDMSLVGPRPILPNEMHKYRGYIGYYLSVKPALTGLWQINGRNNTTYNRRIALDMTYVRKNSVLLDIAILVRTVPVLLRTDGAY
ncbi:MAG: sugar transferase [Alteripontixanthobacter sp.]